MQMSSTSPTNNNNKKSRPRRATFSNVVPVEPHGSSPEENRGSMMKQSSNAVDGTPSNRSNTHDNDEVYQHHQSRQSDAGRRAMNERYYQITGDYDTGRTTRDREGSVSSVDTADLMDHRPSMTGASGSNMRSSPFATKKKSQSVSAAPMEHSTHTDGGGESSASHQAGTGHEFSARKLLAAHNSKLASSPEQQQQQQSFNSHKAVDRWVKRRSSLSTSPLLPNRHQSNNGGEQVLSPNTSAAAPMDYNAITDGLNGGDSFAISMDDSQYNNNNQGEAYDPFGGHEEEEEEEEEPRSNPSSRRSSNASSLDDVCFPLDSPREIDSYTGESRMWPDLELLQEFADEEIKTTNQQEEPAGYLDEDEQAETYASSLFNADYNNNNNMPPPPQSHIENETDLEGRLRPHRIIPWAQRTKGGYLKKIKNDQRLPFISNGKGSPQLRFTYFREDMDSTVHSANISGLLQSGLSFEELFPPRIPHRHSPSASQPTVPAATGRNNTYQHQRNQHSGSNNHSNSNNGFEDFNEMEINEPPVRGATPVSGLPEYDNNNSDLSPKMPSRSQTPGPSPNKKSSSKQQTKPQPNRSQSTPYLPAQGLAPTPPLAGGGSTTPMATATTSSSSEPAPFWLNVMNPTEEEMKVLSKAFGIHPLTTEDIFLGETREKVELFRNYYLVCFRSIDLNWEKEKTKHREREKQNKALNSKSSNTRLKSTSGGYSEIPQQQQQEDSILRRRKNSTNSTKSTSSTLKERRKKREHFKARSSELKPLNMYILVFHEGVLTFHFSPTPHPINVRRRARLLRDYITVSSDWISYALIDDVTDGFAPMIEAIEDEVNSIEDTILKMHSGDESSDSSDSEDEDGSSATLASNSSSNSSNSTTKVWKEKGDMLRRIGECRKRVMSLLRLLGSKADVIKGFSKRCNEQWEVAPRSEIGLYLGDIQDHIVTMVQSLNHYEKLLARSHSNYLAQINIDMTRVNNDMNDVLGRITVLGTIVLPMNIVTGLWGMNVLVPGQDIPNLYWFWGITFGLLFFAFLFFWIARRVYKLV